jgi:hypothetical protein
MALARLNHQRPPTWGELADIRARYVDQANTTKAAYRADVLALGQALDHALNLLHQAVGLKVVCRDMLLPMLCPECTQWAAGTNKAQKRYTKAHEGGTCTCFDANPNDALASASTIETPMVLEGAE